MNTSKASSILELTLLIPTGPITLTNLGKVATDSEMANHATAPYLITVKPVDAIAGSLFSAKRVPASNVCLYFSHASRRLWYILGHLHLGTRFWD